MFPERIRRAARLIMLQCASNCAQFHSRTGMHFPGTSALPRVKAYTHALPIHSLITLGLLLVAALPRLWHLVDFFTIDEVFHWTQRTQRFSAAPAAHDCAATNLTGHPGVTLLWHSSGGLALERAAVANGWIAPPSALEYLAWLR